MVAHCQHKVDGLDYAVKKISIGRYKEFDYENVQREVEVMSKLKHNHIVAYVFSFVDAVFAGEKVVAESVFFESGSSDTQLLLEQCPCLCIVQELCDGTLREHLSNGNMKKLPGEKRLDILFQITRGLEYLHSKGFVHGDLKPENILVLGDEWKVGDFGLAHRVGLGTDFSSSGEFLHGNYHPLTSEVDGKHLDMYSLGLIIAELKLLPDTVSERSRIFSTLRTDSNGVSKLFGRGILSGLLDALLGDPEERPGASGVFPVFTSLKVSEKFQSVHFLPSYLNK